ncbi:MAG: hypothetical protein ABI382_03410, partial [Nakamurella sp.]
STAPRLAVLSLPLRTATTGSASGAHAPSAQGRTAGAQAETRMTPSGALRASTASAPPAAPIRRSVAPHINASFTNASHINAPHINTAQPSATSSAPAGVRGSDINPSTVSLMRQSRVAPPSGVVTRAAPSAPPASARLAEGTRTALTRADASTTAALGGPAIPASAFGEDSVIRRFFEAATPSGGRRRSSAVRSGSAPSVIGGHREPSVTAGLGGSPVIGGHREPSVTAGLGGSPVIGGHRSPAVVNADPPARTDSPIGASLTSREWAELVEEVTRRIEDRVVAEMSRRGRRNMPRPM